MASTAGRSGISSTQEQRPPGPNPYPTSTKSWAQGTRHSCAARASLAMPAQKAVPTRAARPLTPAKGDGSSLIRNKQCAGEDLNLHGVLTPQGPQPCASTNSATSARADCSGGSRDP